MRKRKWTDEQLIEAVKNNFSISGVIRELKLKPSGGTSALVKAKIAQLQLNDNHFTGQAWCVGDVHRAHCRKFLTYPLECILVKNSTYQSTSSLKAKLFEENLLKNKCSKCGLSDEWNNAPIVLELDHIDGDRTNNLIENLRILCPNCHSQTPTSSGKNAKRLRAISGIPLKPKIRRKTKQLKPKIRRKTKQCLDCKNLISRKANRCKSCVQKSTKIIWPAPDVLQTMVDKSNYTAVAKQLGVSDNAIRKRLKNHS